MSDDLRFRLAIPEDAGRIARLHADNWRRTYRGVLSDRWLDADLDADRAARWRAWAGSPERATATVTVVCDAGDELAGFVHAVVDDHDELGSLIDNLHVQPHLRRHGIARLLMGEAGRRLGEQAESAGAYLLVLQANTGAQQFYEAIGGLAVARSRWDAPDGTAVPDVTYSWPDVLTLAALLPPGAPPLAQGVS
jgi:ribosomal protein S18 acetylase RimI-like enzyme